MLYRATIRETQQGCQPVDDELVIEATDAAGAQMTCNLELIARSLVRCAASDGPERGTLELLSLVEDRSTRVA